MKIKIKRINILISLVVFSTLVPFINIFPSFSIQAVCMLGAAFYIALPAVRHTSVSRSTFFLLLFFLGWLMFSLSGFTESRVSIYVPLSSFMLLAIGASRIRNSEKFPEYMIKITGIVSAFFTIFYSYNKTAYANYARSTYPEDAAMLILDNLNGNIAGLYNHYSKNGMVLAMATGILFVSFLYANNSRWKKINFLLLLTCAIALLFSGKRGPIIFTVLSAGICYVLSMGKKISLKKILKIILLAIIVILSFIVLSNFIPQLARFIQRFEEAEEAGSITMGRDAYYAYAISMFLSSPLLGHGWFSFVSVIGQNVHNIYLQLLAETGILGFLFFVCGFLYILWTAVSEYRKSQISGDRFGMCQLLKAVFIIVFFLLYGFTGNPLYDALMFCPFFIAIGIMRFYHENRGKQDRNFYGRKEIVR